MNVSDFGKIAKAYDLQTNLEYDALTGNYEGYSVVLKVQPALTRCLIELSVKQGDILPSSNMDDFIAQMKQKHSMIHSMEYLPFRMRMSLKVNPAHAGNMDILKEILDHVFSYLKTNHYRACCEHCGRDTNLHTYELKEAPFILCHVCHEDLEKQTIALQEEISRDKESILTGSIGAIFGCILGAAVWIGMYYLHMPAAAAGILLSFFTIWFYQLCYGKICTAAYAIMFLLMTITITGCQYFAFIQDIYATLQVEFSLTMQEAISKVPIFLGNSDIWMGLLLDYGVSMLLMIVTSVFMLLHMKKIKAIPYTLHDLEDIGLHISSFDT